MSNLDTDLGVKEGVGGKRGVVTFGFSVFPHQENSDIKLKNSST